MRNDVTVYNRMRALRKEKGWSQRELAEHIEVSRQSINAIEMDKYSPSLALAFKIAETFAVTIEEIFDPRRNPEEMNGE